MGRGRADGQSTDAQLLQRRQGAQDPALIEARRRLGVRQRPVPVLGRLGVGPWDDWSKETRAQMWLRVYGPASSENLQKIADRLTMNVDELPPMTENEAFMFYVGSTARERTEAAQRLRARKARWDRQGGQPSPSDAIFRLYDATLELADVLETKAAETGRSDLDRIQIEEKLAGLVGANPNRLEPLYYGRSWQSLLNDAGFDEQMVKAVGDDPQSAAAAEQLSQRICRADLLERDLRLARYLMRSMGLRDQERFMPIRDLFVNPKSDSIHGWLNRTDVGGRSEWQRDFVSKQDGALDRGWLTAQLLLLRRDKQQPYASNYADRAIRWLTSPSEALAGQIPADLVRSDPVGNFAQLEAAAAADPVEPYLEPAE